MATSGVASFTDLLNLVGANPQSAMAIYSESFALCLETVLKNTETAGVNSWEIIQSLNALGKVVVIGGAVRDLLRPTHEDVGSAPVVIKDLDIQFDIGPERITEVKESLGKLGVCMDEVKCEDRSAALKKPALYLKVGSIVEGWTLEKSGMAENDVNSLRYVVQDRVLVDMIGTGLVNCQCKHFSVLLTGRVKDDGAAFVDFESWYSSVPPYFKNSVHMRIGKMFVKGFAFRPLEEELFKKWFTSKEGSQVFVKCTAYLLNFCGITTGPHFEDKQFKGFAIKSKKEYDGAYMEEYFRHLRGIVGQEDPTVLQIEKTLADLTSLDVGALLPKL